MDKNWAIIFSCGNLQKAELIKNLLEHNEIPSVIINHQDSLYKFGDISVYVNREDAVKAKYVLKENNTI
jgi:predicted MarR family transcription regulator